MGCARKVFTKVLTVSTVVTLFAMPVLAAEQKEKGALVRFWDNMTSRFSKGDTAAEQDAVPEKRPAAVKTPTPAEVPETPVSDKEITSVRGGGEPASDINVLRSRKAIVDEINGLLDANPGVVEKIPELSVRKSVSGEMEYYYTYSTSIPMKLDTFDRDVLYDLMVKIRGTIKDIAKSSVSTSADETLPERSVPAPAEEAVRQEESAGEEALVGGDGTSSPPERPKREIPLSKEELVSSIEKRLAVYPDIAYMVPSLGVVDGGDGEKEYIYVTMEGEVMPLLDADKESLYDIFVRVNNEASRINTQRLMNQLQQQEQLRRAVQQVPQPPQPPPQPPRPPQPPQVYTPPPQPPQPPQQPQIPAPPPQQPRR